MEAYKSVVENSGVTNLAAICAICKAQFTKILPQYGFGMTDIISLHQLVSEAIILTGSEDDDSDTNDSEKTINPEPDSSGEQTWLHPVMTCKTKN